MDDRKRKALEKHGWRVGSTAEFLDLTNVEVEFVEIKAALAVALFKKRQALKLSQTDAAERLESSQSRLAKMEANDRSVSLDLLVRSLFKLGANPKELARIISSVTLPPRRRRVAV